MKQKKIVIVLCAVIFAVVVVSEGIREFSEAAREVQVNDVIRQLAVEITYFQIQEGHYPHSLAELPFADYLDERDKKSSQEVIGITQHNRWHETYNYVATTNGFTIIVIGPESGPAGWFGKQRRIEKHYQIGEDVK